MFSWYTLWMEQQQNRRALDRKLEARRLARDIQDGKERPAGLLPRLLLTLGCWFVERAWQLRNERGVLRWGRIEIIQIAPTQCEES